jgi:hypothetical protein
VRCEFIMLIVDSASELNAEQYDQRGRQKEATLTLICDFGRIAAFGAER